MRLLMAAAVAAASLSFIPSGVRAQDWFVPGGQQRPAQGHPPPAPRPVQRQAAPMPAPAGPMLMPMPPEQAQEQEQAPPIPMGQFQLPPEPAIPPLAKGSPPPAAVIGVLGVPEVMRACVAAQEVERVIGQRRQKLSEDAQKEQTAWRDLQQQLVAQRSTMNPDQIRAKERELQERITNAQRVFRDRNRIIQEAAQFALAQIERTLIGVIRQVAESRGMNLVLHRNQIALNVNEFDLTDQVTAQLNKVLPSVAVPPDGQEPPMIPLAQGQPGPAMPAAAPAPAAPAAPAPTAAAAPAAAPAAPPKP